MSVYLRSVSTGEVITAYVTLYEKQSVNRTVHVAIDGTEYITRFGKPTMHYELSAYVNEDGKLALMQAEDSLELLECCVSRGVYRGRIISLSEFTALPQHWYKVTITLSAVSEVS